MDASIICEILYSYGGKVFLPLADCNEIYSWDGRKDELDFICYAGESEEYSFRKFSDMVFFKDKYYLAPFFSDEIFCFTEEGKTDSLEIPAISSELAQYEGKAKFVGVAENEETIFFVSAGYPGFVRFDGSKTDVIDNWVYDYLQLDNLNSDSGFFRDYAVSGNELLLPVYRGDYVMTLNMDSLEYSFVDVLGDKKGFSAIAVYEDCIFLATKYTGKIIKYNIKSKKAETVFSYPENNLNEMVIISKLLIYRESLWVFPYSERAIYRISLKDYSFERVLSRDIDLCANGIGFGEGVLVSIPREGKLLYSKSEELDELQTLKFPNKYNDRHIRHYSELYRALSHEDTGTNLFYEEYEGALSDFISLIAQK